MKRASKKKASPKNIAITVIISTNRSNSFRRGVFGLFYVATKSAICPITVFSPMFITIPLPFPCWQRVPKNARFLDYKG